MRIVNYTRSCYLDHSLSLIHAMSTRAEMHVLLELSPEGRTGGMFGEELLEDEPVGVHSADSAVEKGYLAGATPFVSNLASFNLVVHGSRRAFTPDALRTGLTAAARVRRLRPDVIHVEEESARALPLFLLTPGVPKVLAIHDAQRHPGEPPGRRDAVRRLAVARSAHLLFYSHYSQTSFARRQPGRPSSVVPLGVKEVFRSWPGPDVPECPNSLLFFGRIAPYKGLDVLYRALPRIASRVPRLRVVVAGRPSAEYPPPAPPAMPANATLIQHFETIGNAEVRRLFQQASVVVVPYVEASQSGVIQTAYAFGKPVVASAIGGLVEAVVDGVTGLLVPPGQPDQLATAVVELLLSQSRRDSMRRAIAQREQTHFGWQVIARQLTDLYATLAATSPRAVHPA